MSKIYIKSITVLLMLLLAVSTMGILINFGLKLIICYLGITFAVIGLLFILTEG